MDKENERNSIRFLNHIHHYKRRYPAGKWSDYWSSSRNNSNITNLDHFVEQNFSLATLKFIVPKFVRLFDYDDVDGQILYLLINDIDVLEIQDLLEQRIEQSRKDKLLHTITRLIKILIQLGNKNMQMDEVMILDKAIENLQSNLKIVVKCNNNKLFEGTIGELSTKYSTLGQRRIKYQPFYDSKIETYIVEIV